MRRWTAPKRLKRTFPGEFDSILELDRIIIPVHLGIHWVCAVISLQDSQIWWFDSLGVSVTAPQAGCTAMMGTTAHTWACTGGGVYVVTSLQNSYF